MNFILNPIDCTNKFLLCFKNYDKKLMLEFLSSIIEFGKKRDVHIEDKDNFKQSVYNVYQRYDFDNIPDFKDTVDFLYNLLKSVEAKYNKDKINSFVYINEAFQALVKIFKEQENLWLLYVMKYFMKELRLSVFETMDEHKENNDENVYLRSAITSVRSLVSLINLSKAQAQYSKKRAIVFCATELCHMSFKIWKYKDCEVIINDAENFMENSGLPPDSFSKSDRVTLKYYAGRIALFENQFIRAENELEIAFRECHEDSFKNQRLILQYLIPAKLICGKFPPIGLIEKYKLYEYVDLTKSVYEGNIALFREQKRKFRKLWIKRSLYISFEKLEFVLLRNLFKRVYKLVKKTIVDTEYFVKALNISNTLAYDIDEVESLMGNLILKGFIKGYISHDKRKVVFSQNEPFPKFEKIYDK